MSQRVQATGRIVLAALTCGVAGFVVAAAYYWSTAPLGPRINVRWAVAATVERRGAAESALGLHRGLEGEERTWSYEIPSPTSESLRAILTHELVEDTHGFDRDTLTPPPSVASRILEQAFGTARTITLIAAYLISVVAFVRGGPRQDADGLGPGPAP